MVRATVDLLEVEASITHVRPQKATKHPGHDGDEMQDDIGQILVTDRNREPSEPLTDLLPLPHWNNGFDYYHADLASDPAAHGREYKVVDASAGARQVTGAVEKLVLGAYQGVTIHKVARQGEFDNLHLAPRMKTTFRHKGSNVTLSNIAMAPFCVHDCLHTHFRWGNALGQPPALHIPVSNRGFNAANEPYSALGAPLVPTNQTVFLKLVGNNGFRYRAIARSKRIPTTEWTLFNHHGSYAAIALWPTFAASAMMTTARVIVDEQARLFQEPFSEAFPVPAPNPFIPPSETVVLSLSAVRSFAALYYRLRFGGEEGTSGPIPKERIRIIDFNKCLT
jgi:hypothetical protein